MSKVAVSVRIRPFTDDELEEFVNDDRALAVEVEDNTISMLHYVNAENVQKRTFKFDTCYNSMDAGDDDEDSSATNEDVYNDMVKPTILDVISGYNASIISYGQTGTGKTYTMSGGADVSSDAGVMQRAAEDLFAELPKHDGITVTASFIEIYNEQVVDLLDPRSAVLNRAANGSPTKMESKLRVREHPDLGAFADGKMEIPISSAQEMLDTFTNGQKARHISTTAMSSTSSRSHAIFSIVLKHKTGSLSGLNFVDLAGTGQGDGNVGTKQQKLVGRTSDKVTLAEGAAINKSLATLGMVMTALAKNAKDPGPSASPLKKAHVPYRDSTLTWLLKGAIGGNSKTVLLASISPSANHFEESVSTLKFAERAKNVINTARTKLTKSRAVLEAEAAAAQRAAEEEEERLRRAEEDAARALAEQEHMVEQRMRELAEKAARKKAREEEQKRLAEEERLRKIEEERLRKLEEERLRKEEEERLRKEEEERLRKAEEERLRMEEEERLRREEEERLRKEEEERLRKEEEERRKKEAEEERLRKEEEERLRKEEEERLRKEEEDRLRREEQERLRKEDEERLRKEEEERLRKEEEERLRKEEEERLRKEEEARKIKEEEDRIKWEKYNLEMQAAEAKKQREEVEKKRRELEEQRLAAAAKADEERRAAAAAKRKEEEAAREAARQAAEQRRIEEEEREHRAEEKRLAREALRRQQEQEQAALVNAPMAEKARLAAEEAHARDAQRSAAAAAARDADAEIDRLASTNPFAPSPEKAWRLKKKAAEAEAEKAAFALPDQSLRTDASVSRHEFKLTKQLNEVKNNELSPWLTGEGSESGKLSSTKKKKKKGFALPTTESPDSGDAEKKKKDKKKKKKEGFALPTSDGGDGTSESPTPVNPFY